MLAPAVAILVLAVVLFVLRFRLRQGEHERALREAIRAYVEARGGSVVFDEQGMIVKGPRGEGRERLTALRIMCDPRSRSRWPTTIGFALRKYIPDAFDDAFAKGARERLAKALPEIEALSAEDLLARVRVRICSQRAPTEGLVTCAAAIGERFEARVVLDGFEIDGVPTDVRSRLADSDGALRERALAATLAEPPGRDVGEAPNPAWLCRLDAIFGNDPFLVACDGQSLVWLAARQGTSEGALAALAARSMSSGPMKGAMFAWSGTTLHDVPVIAHTIIGPSTPDYTLKLPAEIAGALGVVTSQDGEIGVRR